MPDYYHVPSLVLSALLLPAFGYLYYRFRDTRTLLWFMGFVCSLASMVLLYPMGGESFSPGVQQWMTALGMTAQLVGSALFLSSLSPLRFRLGRWQILYGIPYVLPQVVVAILYFGVFHESTEGPLRFLYPTLGALSYVVAVLWSARKDEGSMPLALSLTINVLAGAGCFWAIFTLGIAWAIHFVQCGNFLVSALLILYVFRRPSPGVFLSMMGFIAWSLRAIEAIPAVTRDDNVLLQLIHVIVMGKVVAAVGMILLALEDELNFNQVARERERRARHELAAYSGLILSRRRVEDFDRLGDEICAAVVANSRFAQAALVLERGGRYQVAGSGGLTQAASRALNELVERIPLADFLASGTTPTAVERGQTLRLDLEPWLAPGDDLKQMHLTPVLAVPMAGRVSVEGALLLMGMRKLHKDTQFEELRPDDLLPLEMLAARLQATRNQVQLFEKLIDSEKFAGLGQLASNVTQQLNNPLTVILGYASLIGQTAELDPRDRKGVEAILSEARRMRETLETLSRVSRVHGDQLSAVSISELMADMEQLYRAEFLQRAIEFRLNIAPDLPRVSANAQQLRQAVLHSLQFALTSVEKQSSEAERWIRLEASCEGGLVQIMIAHSGESFAQPAQAFDPFAPTQSAGESSSLGLSLCSTILRDNQGRASAVNLEPRGAAILLELRAIGAAGALLG
jgi:signal transduction histidine kinase